MNYALTGIKEARGEETPRFDAYVTLDGRKIASVGNAGTGGCCDWHWHDRSAQAPFEAWIKANTTETFEPEDDWVYDQLTKYAEQKQLMRLSLKKTVFMLEGDKPEEGWRLVNHPDDAAVRDYLRKKYTVPAQVYDRSLKQFVAI